MEKFIVYLTINLCNGKFYIGVHQTNPEVFDGYIGNGIYRQQQATKEYPFHRAVQKYGYKNFKRTTLKIFDTREEAYAFEGLLVTETLLKSRNCYNTNLGGLGGNSKKVYQFDLKGNLINIWESADQAIIRTGFGHITGVCRGERNQAGGYYWSYTNKFEYTPGIDQSKEIAQYTQSGKFLRTWPSLKAAQRALGIYNINRAIKQDILCGGYQWRFYDGINSDISPKMIKKFSKLLNSKIAQIDSEGNIIEIWNDIESLHLNGFERKYVRNVLRGKQNTYKGYKFKFIEEQDEDIVSTFNEN